MHKECKHALVVQCMHSNAGLTSAEGQKLECFKWTTKTSFISTMKIHNVVKSWKYLISVKLSLCACYAETRIKSRCIMHAAGATTFIKMTLIIIDLIVTLSINDTQLNNTWHNQLMSLGWVFFCWMSVCWVSLYWVSWHRKTLNVHRSPSLGARATAGGESPTLADLSSNNTPETSQRSKKLANRRQVSVWHNFIFLPADEEDK